jgi:hypothetical protein
MRQQLSVVAVAASLGTACRPQAAIATVAASPGVVDRRPAPPSPGPVAAWTTARAADPELVHLHIQAAAAPGAFLVPWIEGVSFSPCRVRVRNRDAVVQDARLTYDATGRLAAIVATGPAGDQEAVFERDGGGRLLAARGFVYVYSGARLQSIAQQRDRVHVLQYDTEGRLVVIRTEIGGSDAGGLELLYDEDRLVERRFIGPDGRHAETYFIHDANGRLVRVDAQSTDASGRKRMYPSFVLEYDGDRLVQFGYATIEYDEQDRPSAVLNDDGTRTEYEYEYAC